LVAGVGAEEIQVVLDAFQIGALEVYLVALRRPLSALLPNGFQAG
jgi:hypothetical protein